jgi:hypothetical protein
MNTKRLIELDNKLLVKYKTPGTFIPLVRKLLEELTLDSLYLFLWVVSSIINIGLIIIQFIKDEYWWILPMLGWTIYEVLY